MDPNTKIRLLQNIGAYTVKPDGTPETYLAREHPFLRDLAEKKANKGGKLICHFITELEEDLAGKQCEVISEKTGERCTWTYSGKEIDSYIKVLTPANLPWISRLRGAKLLVCPQHHGKLVKKGYTPRTVRG